jgi:putative peptidoglycan lipid II flippase
VAALALYPVLGVEGLGLAFALAYTAGTAAALVDLRRRAGGVDGTVLARSITRILAASALMAGAVAAVHALTDGLGDDGVGAAVRVGAATVAGVTVYVAGCRVFRVGELRSLLAFRRRG